jgi:hypothetical protein
MIECSICFIQGESLDDRLNAVPGGEIQHQLHLVDGPGLAACN